MEALGLRPRKAPSIPAMLFIYEVDTNLSRLKKSK